MTGDASLRGLAPDLFSDLFPFIGRQVFFCAADLRAVLDMDIKIRDVGPAYNVVDGYIQGVGNFDQSGGR